MSFVIIITFGGCKGSTYKSAIKSIKSGDYDKAIEMLSNLGDYEDAQDYLAYSKALKTADDGKYSEAVSLMDSMGAFEDAENYALYFTARDYEESGKYGSAIRGYREIPEFMDSKQRVLGIIDSVYNRALSEGKEGKFDEAIKDLGDVATWYGNVYKDSGNWLVYYNGRNLELQDVYIQYVTAADSYTTLGDFEDSSERAKNINSHLKSRYTEAIALGNEGNYRDAADELSWFVDYKESESYEKYFNALAEFSIGNYVSAIELLSVLGTFNNSDKKVDELKESIYNGALAAIENGDFYKAQKDFSLLSNYTYKDSYNYAKYTEGMYNDKIGNYMEALWAYTSVRDFKDSRDKFDALLSKKLKQANKYTTSGQYEDAKEIYNALGNGLDSIYLKYADYVDAYEYEKSFDEISVANAKEILKKYNELNNCPLAVDRAVQFNKETHNLAYIIDPITDSSYFFGVYNGQGIPWYRRVGSESIVGYSPLIIKVNTTNINSIKEYITGELTDIIFGKEAAEAYRYYCPEDRPILWFGPAFDEDSQGGFANGAKGYFSNIKPSNGDLSGSENEVLAKAVVTDYNSNDPVEVLVVRAYKDGIPSYDFYTKSMDFPYNKGYDSNSILFTLKLNWLEDEPVVQNK